MKRIRQLLNQGKSMHWLEVLGLRERHVVRRAAAVVNCGTALPARPHQLKFDQTAPYLRAARFGYGAVLLIANFGGPLIFRPLMANSGVMTIGA